MLDTAIELRLTVPECSGEAPPDQRDPERVRAWLTDLPKLNERQMYTALIERLRDMNRQRMPAPTRLAILECLHSEILDLVTRLTKRCSQFEFPLSEQEEGVSQRLNHLYEELAFGYKHILHEQQRSAKDPAGLRSLLYRLMELLAQQILHAMSVYREPPAGTWQTLHDLYRYAESRQLAEARMPELADSSIADLYARILLLSVADPTHLLQGEADETYASLEKWAKTCRFRHPNEYDVESLQALLKTHCHVDLASDSGARLGQRSGQAQAREPRLLEIDEVLRILERRIRFLTLKQQPRLTERTERDLLQRLLFAWSLHPSRARQRCAGEDDLRVVSGLRGCYAMLVGSGRFAPEQDEIRLHGDDFRAPSQLSLVGRDEEPWRRDDTRGKLEQGLIRPRGFGFDVVSKEDDVWERQNRVGVARDSALEASVEHKTANRQGEFQVRDSSTDGVGASCVNCTLRFRVGDLIGLLEVGSSGMPALNLGLVRWLKNPGQGSLRLGLARLPGTPTPLAVRGIEGHGAANDYQRALLLSGTGKPTLIVPAGLFDVGSVLLLNDGTSLKLCRLDPLLRSTKAFAEYGMQMIEFNEARRQAVIAIFYKLLERSVE